MYFSSIVKLERIIASGDEKVQPIKAKTLPRSEGRGNSHKMPERHSEAATATSDQRKSPATFRRRGFEKVHY
jgi:hypothetical protein